MVAIEQSRVNVVGVVSSLAGSSFRDQIKFLSDPEWTSVNCFEVFVKLQSQRCTVQLMLCATYDCRQEYLNNRRLGNRDSSILPNVQFMTNIFRLGKKVQRYGRPV